MFMHFSCIRTFNSLYSYVLICLVLFCVFLSLTLLLSLVALWHLNGNLLRPRTLFIPGHLFLIPPLPTLGSMMIKPVKTFLENFSRRGIHSKCQVILSNFFNTDLPTVIHNRGWESLCSASVTCPSMIIRDFYSNMYRFDYLVPHLFTRVRGMRFVVTPDIVSEMLHAPRVMHPDYPGYDRLKTVSKDKLISLFCERPSWGDSQNTRCSAFAKSSRFLNMVMTFVLHSLSHYNSITKPRARFLLSLLEHISIDFPSHFILSLIDVYRDMATRDKLIFPLAIMRIIRHFSVSYPELDHFSIMCAIDAAIVKWSEA